MLHKLTIPGIEIPNLYVASTMEESEQAADAGIPFVRWNRSDNELIKYILRPTLEKLFPCIKWDSVLGPKQRFRTNIQIDREHYSKDDPINEEGFNFENEDEEINSSSSKSESFQYDTEDDINCEYSSIAETKRYFNTEGYDDDDTVKLSIEEYIGDISSQVNIDVLQSLKLMPAFIGDILNCIRTNLSNRMRWTQGYTKKLDMCQGNYNRGMQLPNLIILDVSGSIPRGISATMISLIDTLRTEVSADLIITASTSRFYPFGTELPDPNSIRCKFGYGNESEKFAQILENDLADKHYGHIFSFGDYDSFYTSRTLRMDNFSVNQVHHYHTYKEDTTGYADWCRKYSQTMPEETVDNTWCEVIER